MAKRPISSRRTADLPDARTTRLELNADRASTFGGRSHEQLAHVSDTAEQRVAR